MKKNLSFLLASITTFTAVGQSALIPFSTTNQRPAKLLLADRVDGETAITRSSCTDKIKFVDQWGAPAAGDFVQIGGAATLAANPTTCLYQVYPGFTGKVSRIDFQGGKFSSSETVTVELHPISSGIPVTGTILGTATASVSTASGEFGGAFSSPINVTNGFAVAVYISSVATDSIKLFTTPSAGSSYGDYSWLEDNTGALYSLYANSIYLDFLIRPTISFTLGAPTLTATPASFCAGSSSYIDYSAYPAVSWTSTEDYIYNPNGFSSQFIGTNINFGDATTGTSLPTSHTYSTAGSYTVSATMTYDGWTTDCISDPGTKALTVNPAPVANFSWSSANLAVTFNNLSTGATTYSWLFGDAGTATAPNPVHNYAASGTYTVELTANGACGTNTIYVNIAITDSTNAGNVGMVEMEQGILTNIYPNPANEFINIDISLTNPETTNLQVMDINGKLLFTTDLGSISSINQQIDITGFAPGMYFVRLVHNGKVSGRKFIKQ